MSDFLSNLVVGQLQPGTMLRPRPASRFEPLAAATAGIMTEPIAGLEAPGPKAPRRDDEQPGAASPPLDVVEAGPPAPVRERKVRDSRDGLEAPASPPGLPDVEPTPAKGVIADTPAVATSSEARLEVRERYLVREVPSVVHEKDRGAPITEEPEPPAITVLVPEPAGNGWAPPHSEPPLLVAPVASLRIEGRPALEPAAGPAIQVTIGRIEIRAASPVADKAPRKADKPTGIMTLEEYVQRRSRGQG
jgi:hypothetical protein